MMLRFTTYDLCLPQEKDSTDEADQILAQGDGPVYERFRHAWEKKYFEPVAIKMH